MNNIIPPLTNAAASRQTRSLKFAQNPHRRFFWHKWANSDFVPPLYTFLDDDEWLILDMWFKETEQRDIIGESGIPLMSLLQGFIMGSRIRRIVQLGTYSGYSSLLMGFMLRRMGMTHGLFSADIDQMTTDFANKYVQLAGLEEQVKLVVQDSKSPALVDEITRYFDGNRPQMVLIDSSHQMEQTLVELDLWYDALIPGGLLVLHDTSAFAQAWDSTKKGGVKVAFDQWQAKNPGISCLNIDCAASQDPNSPSYVYQDGCGVGLIYKRHDR